MKSGLKKNLIYSVGYQILIMIIPFIVTPYISRVLMPEQLGEYNHANSLAYYFFLFSMLGVNSYGTREISKAKNDQSKLRSTFWQIYYIQFFLAILFIVLYVFLLYALKLNKYLYFIQIIYLCSIFFDINWLALGLERFQSYTIRTGGVKLLSILLIFLLVKGPEDIWIYGLIMTASVTISLIFIWPIVFYEVGFQLPDFKAIVKHIKPNAQLILPYLTASVFTYLDSFMIGFIGNVEDVAYYTYSNSLPNMLLSITTGIISVMMSRMSYLSEDSKEKSDALFTTAVKYTTILNIALTVGAIGVARNFITIYLGAQYSVALPMFYVMLLTVPLNGFSSFVRSAYMIPNSMDQQATKSAAIGGVVKLVLNILFISSIGVLGVCISSVISYVVIIIVQYVYTKDLIKYFQVLKYAFYCFVTAGIMLLYLSIIGRLNISIYYEIVLQVVGGAMIYVVGIAAFLYLKKDPVFLSVVGKFTGKLK